MVSELGLFVVFQGVGCFFGNILQKALAQKVTELQCFFFLNYFFPKTGVFLGTWSF